MYFLKAFEFASVALLQLSRGLETGANVVDQTVDPAQGNERKVQLHLDRMHVTTAFLSNTVSSTNDDAEMLEIFKVPVEFLNKETWELLQAGGTIEAKVVPIAPFRFRDEANGEVIVAPTGDVSERLLTSTAPSLCGPALARGLMSLSFNGKSIASKTSYFRMEESADQEHRNLSVHSRRLQTPDICENIDQIIGRCAQDNVACSIKYTRKKRVQKEMGSEWQVDHTEPQRAKSSTWSQRAKSSTWSLLCLILRKLGQLVVKMFQFIAKMAYRFYRFQLSLTWRQIAFEIGMMGGVILLYQICKVLQREARVDADADGAPAPSLAQSLQDLTSAAISCEAKLLHMEETVDGFRNSDEEVHERLARLQAASRKEKGLLKKVEKEVQQLRIEAKVSKNTLKRLSLVQRTTEKQITKLKTRATSAERRLKELTNRSMGSPDTNLDDKSTAGSKENAPPANVA